MTDIPPARPVRKLPVEIVVKRAFLFSWESRHVLAMPFLIYAALTILAELITVQFSGPKNPGPEQILTIVEEFFMMAFAVGVHRFVLLGEARPSFQFFRWDRYLVRYALITILLFVLMFLAALPSIGMALRASGGTPSGADGMAALFGMVTVFLALIILTRLSLLLPSAAIGDETRARAIWEVTQGNSFRLLAATLLTSLPFLIVEAALYRLMPDNEAGAVGAIVRIAIGITTPAQLIVLTVLLALCYDLLVRGNGPVVTDRRNG